MSSGRIKVAVIGAGGWGYQHLRVFTARNDVRVVGVAGRTPEKTRRRAAEFRVKPYLDAMEMLAQERPDLVSLCLPNQEHFAPTLAVIRAGFPLLVEKPLVFDLHEADTLLAEAERRNLFFAINFNHRYARPVQMAQEAIGKGRLGEVVFATWRFGGEGGADHPFNNLIETQCHGFDMLEHLCGPIESAMAQMTDKTRPGSFTTMALALRFANGAVGSLVGSYDSSYAYPGTHMLEVNGTKGRLRIEDTVRKFTFHPVGSEVGETWQAGYFNEQDRSFLQTFDRHVDALLAAFRRGEAPPVHARAGRRALALAQACVQSFREGRRVSV